MVARRAHNPKVVGSNPALATIFIAIKKTNLRREVEQLGSSSGFITPKVVGSNPALATIFIAIKKTNLRREVEQLGSSSGS